MVCVLRPLLLPQCLAVHDSSVTFFGEVRACVRESSNVTLHKWTFAELKCSHA